MWHSAGEWEHRVAIEITKDWNGVEQVVLQNQQGASARVRFENLLFSPLIKFLKALNLQFVIKLLVHLCENFCSYTILVSVSVG